MAEPALLDLNASNLFDPDIQLAVASGSRDIDLPVDSSSDVVHRDREGSAAGSGSTAWSSITAASPTDSTATNGVCEFNHGEESGEGRSGAASNRSLKRKKAEPAPCSGGPKCRRSVDGDPSPSASASRPVVNPPLLRRNAPVDHAVLTRNIERNIERSRRMTANRRLEVELRNWVMEITEWVEFLTKVKRLGSILILSLPSGFRYLTKKVASVILLGFTSLFRYLNKKVVIVGLLGLLFLILIFGTFLVFSHSFGMRRGSGNTIFNNFGASHGRMLIGTNHVKWSLGFVHNSGMLSVGLRKMTGNADGSGQGKYWSSHSETLAVLYVLRNGKYVRINCNLIADEKALAHWISNDNSDQSGKHHVETTYMQNGTDRAHLPVQKQQLKTGVVVGIASAIFVVFCSIAGLLLWCMRVKRLQQNQLVQQLELCGGMGPMPFQHHELAAATNNFSDENKLGQGGFGPVYRGYLRDQDRNVAIKVSSQELSEQAMNEFKAEVKIMTQLRHKNIVQLIGWCDSHKGLLLVYELMSEGSLDKHLYDPEKMLTWQQRYKIVLDLGSGLLYLHQDCDKCIVHGDIKPANVMLDASHNAKIGDFGQARCIEHGADPQTTQVIAGTRGYIDPAFVHNHLRCPDADVYSFGVALLEIACGKRPARSQPNGASLLLTEVRDLYNRSMVLTAADRRLNGEFDQQQMERVLVTGLWCAHQDPSQRPSIAQAMDVLRSADAKLPVLPAMRDAQHIRSLEEQAYGGLSDEYLSARAVTATTYLTSKDSAYLLAEE